MHNTLITVLLATASMGALAQSQPAPKFPSLYFSGAIGQSHTALDCAGTLSCDKTDTGVKLLVGVPVHPVVALEVAYVDFGKARFKAPVDGVGVVDGSFKASGWLGAVALRHAFHPQLHGVLRLGASALSTEGQGSAGRITVKLQDDAIKPYVGLGLEFAATRNLQVIGGLDFTRAELEGESASMRLLSIGLQYRM